MKRFKKHVDDFIALESAGGIVLMISAAVALIWSNFSFKSYEHFLHLPFSINLFGLNIDLGLLHFVSDGLMTIFFLMVGAELREEIKEGGLSSFDKIILPLCLAVGGFFLPAGIYLFSTGASPESISGWAIPTATDIAFALGILSLFGKRVPIGLKVTLLALAIFDDLMAIIVIAIGYSNGIDLTYLGLAFGMTALLFSMKYFRVINLSVYFIAGFLLWAFMLKSGVHATLSGVILAFALPYGPTRDEGKMPLKDIQHSLHEFVAFFVIPAFTICNAGINFNGMGLNSIFDPIALAIGGSLVFGKTFGIFFVAFLLISTGVVKKPESTTYPMLLGMAMLAGIGFTMSFFIGGLSDIDPNSYKVGVLVGTAIAAILGSIVLWFSLPKENLNK